MQRLLTPILVKSLQDVTFGGFAHCSHIISLYIQARAFRPTDLTCLLSALTLRSFDHSGGSNLPPQIRSCPALPQSQCFLELVLFVLVIYFKIYLPPGQGQMGNHLHQYSKRANGVKASCSKLYSKVVVINDLIKVVTP